MKKTNFKKMSGQYWDLESGSTEQGGLSGELYLYGTICESSNDFWGSNEDVTPSGLMDSLKELGTMDELNVHIFSNGGDVFAGNAIYALLKQRKEIVNVYIEGIAASIATVIAMAGDNVFIAKNAMFMIHNPMAFCFGMMNTLDMDRLTATLTRVRDVIIGTYVEKTGRTAEEIQGWLDANSGDGTYFTANEAIEMGFVDQITPEGKASAEMAAMIKPDVYACRGREIDMSIYKNPPKLALRAKTERSMTMPKAFKSAKAKKKQRIVAELTSMQCPYCNVAIDFDTVSGQATTKPEENATVAVPLEDNRLKSFKNELFKITCPECGGEFEYETDPDIATQVSPVETSGGGIPQAKKKKMHTAHKFRADVPIPEEEEDVENSLDPVEVAIICTECGTEFTIDVDPTIEEVIVPCPNCDAELTVDTQQSTDPQPEPSPVEETVAMAAVRNERKRITGLEAIANAMPQFADRIAMFKKNGTSVASAQGWVFAALSGKASQTGKYQQAARRDAQVLNGTGNPVRGNMSAQAASIAEKRANLNKRRGIKADG